MGVGVGEGRGRGRRGRGKGTCRGTGRVRGMKFSFIYYPLEKSGNYY